MAGPPLEDLDPHGRRSFFAFGLSRLVRPIADYVQRKLPVSLPVLRPRLRPPGAIEEAAFLDACFRCGRCVEACPAEAISPWGGAGERLNGTPHVDPDRQACVICDELACMKVCPSGALVLVDRMAIRMGLAVVDHGVCVRSKGEDCTECIERCPVGQIAIRLDEAGRVQVIDPEATGSGCTGCGVCQQHCPTRPIRAIHVQPC